MNFFYFIAIILAFAVCAQAVFITEREYQTEFTKFMTQFNKQYTADELFVRYENFKTRLDRVTAHNADTTQTFQMGIHAYSDLSQTEMSAKLNGYKPKAESAKNYVTAARHRTIGLPALPAEVDWRNKGAVTAIKDQGQCGSCWAFSATGSMEGAFFLKYNILQSLSEQQLMDCSVKEGDQSCEGGLMDDAFQYVLDNKGICSEDDYPYKAVDEKCKTGCTKVANITGFMDIRSGDEASMPAAVAMQPVSIAIEADQAIFQDYKNGVLNGTACGTNLDHGVLIVGYGHDNKTGLDYWIVKNSWGKTWGMEGYVWLSRGFNTCGLSLASSYPVV